MRITANQVTLARLILMPLLCWLVYGSATQKLIAVIIGTFVGLTDWLDGYMARKQGPTILGGLMDPIADKVFIALSFVPFADLGYVPWEVVIALFLREYLVTALRSSFELRQRALRSTFLAKMKTWTQMTSLGLVMLMVVVHSEAVLGAVFIGMAALPAVVGVALFVLRRKVFVPAVLGTVLHGIFAAIYLSTGPHAAMLAAMWVMVALTWVSAFDYVKAAAVVIREPKLFDIGRIVPAALLPIVGPLALAEHAAPAWAVIAVMGIEFAHGGLDNLLAHHRAAATGLLWGLRLGAAIAALGLTTIFPEHAVLLGAIAVTISALGTIYTFWTRRRFYLEKKLRDAARAVDLEPPADGI